MTENPPSDSNCSEPFLIRSRESLLQDVSLAGVLRKYPELTPVKQFFETDARFEKADATLHVIQMWHHLGFMKGEPGILQGALVVADFELIRRFDREDLALEKQADSAKALDSHLQFLVRPAPPLS